MRNRQALLSALCLAWVPWTFVATPRAQSRVIRHAQADPYAVLGLQPGTKPDETTVKTAFRQMAKIYHPDVPGTGDLLKFQALQTAAQQLLTGLGGPTWDASSLESLFSASAPVTYASFSQRPPSTAAQPIQQSDFAGSRAGGRVDVAATKAKRSPGLRKTPRVQSLSAGASPETLQRVQAVLATQLGVPPEPSTSLEQLGIYFEGAGNSIGLQSVADAALALEQDFGVELVSIMAGTWIMMPMPPSVRTVQDLADFMEVKAASR
mmetsp:Transcript_69296/g.122658  ORF Transcript_69296/g.122658 Transcript_69296/m.122658 type:complete len:265 (+) Transcript_69296:57-851(+)